MLVGGRFGIYHESSSRTFFTEMRISVHLWNTDSKCLDTHSAIFLSRDFFALDPFLSRDFCLEFTTKNAACVNGTIEITLERIQCNIVANSRRQNHGEFALCVSRHLVVYFLEVCSCLPSFKYLQLPEYQFYFCVGGHFNNATAFRYTERFNQPIAGPIVSKSLEIIRAGTTREEPSCSHHTVNKL